jgi:hypothetical protein
MFMLCGAIAMQRTAKAAAVAVMLLTTAMGRAQEKMAETPYFPLRVGTTWHYKGGDSKFQIRVAAHEKVGDVMAAKLETVKDGKVIAIEHIRVTNDALVRLDVAYFDGDKKVQETAQPPIQLLRLPPKKGESFMVDSKVNDRVYKGTFKISEAEITVPAGMYKTFVVEGLDVEAEGIKAAMTTWYAENVGIVKQKVSAADSTREYELEKFEAGK